MFVCHQQLELGTIQKYLWCLQHFNLHLSSSSASALLRYQRWKVVMWQWICHFIRLWEMGEKVFKFIVIILLGCIYIS